MPLLTGIFASAISGRLTPADAGSMFPLGVFTLSSAQATVDFTNIPQTYTHLQVRYLVRGARAATDSQFAIRLNGNTTGYTRHRVVGDGSSASANGGTGIAYIDAYDVPAASVASSIFGVGIVDILDYKNTNKLKTVRFLRGDDRNGSGSVGLHSSIYTGTGDTNAITTIRLYCADGDIAANSSFALYGVL